MHVLLVAPFGVMEHHYETDLEIAQRHLDAGDRVTLVTCNVEMLACEANPFHELGRCVRCLGRRREGLARLSPQPETVPLLDLAPADREELRRFDIDRLNVEQLRELKVEDFDIGWGVVSTLTSTLGRSDFSLDEHRDLAREFLLTSLAIYRSIQNRLRATAVDHLYLFNGRFATMRAAMRAAQSVGVPFTIHERGSSFQKFALFEGHPPHDLDKYQQAVVAAWEAADPETREMVANGFYVDRFTGSQKDWISYVNGQHAGLMPEGWRSGANNIAIFTSSSDDIDALKDVVTGTVYRDQYEAIDRILASSKDHPDWRLFVRIHPRSHAMPEPGAKRLLAMTHPNLTVIAADSPISTYAIMRQAARVVSFGSTTGIEAAFWRIPSILGFRSFFDRLGSTYNPGSHEEMVSLLSRQLAPNDRTGALKYGYYQKTFGVPFRHFRPLGITGGDFRGSPIKASFPFRIAGVLLDLPVARRAGRTVHLRVLESLMRRT